MPARTEAGTPVGEQAGGYAITQGTLAADSNYTITFTVNTLTITPASLTVSANPQTKVYGTNDPPLAYTASGFQFSDTQATVLTGQLARAAGETVSGSPYAIGQGTLAADSNYTIHFTGSSLSVTAATPILTVSDPGGTYNGSPMAATASVAGVGGTAAASLEGITPILTYYAGSGNTGRIWAPRRLRPTGPTPWWPASPACRLRRGPIAARHFRDRAEHIDTSQDAATVTLRPPGRLGRLRSGGHLRRDRRFRRHAGRNGDFLR